MDDNDEYYNRRPHLAHYTSISNLEKILQSNELWLSNPLYMNDREEVRFGVNQALEIVRCSQEIMTGCGSADRFRAFVDAFENCYKQFAFDHAVNTYVFCMSEHAPDDNDGLLSMWRGYGGNGSGAALVLNAGKITKPEYSALVLARVHYDSAKARAAYLERYARQVAQLLAKDSLQKEELRIPATVLFERAKMFALFTKHKGFEEEREWRIVYTPSRDSKGILAPDFSYSIGTRGIEPRLKFRVGPVEGITAGEVSFESITERIILGPTASSPLALPAFARLLEATNHPALKDRVRASTIPYRD